MEKRQKQRFCPSWCHLSAKPESVTIILKVTRRKGGASDLRGKSLAQAAWGRLLWCSAIPSWAHAAPTTATFTPGAPETKVSAAAVRSLGPSEPSVRTSIFKSCLLRKDDVPWAHLAPWGMGLFSLLASFRVRKKWFVRSWGMWNCLCLGKLCFGEFLLESQLSWNISECGCPIEPPFLCAVSLGRQHPH